MTKYLILSILILIIALIITIKIATIKNKKQKDLQKELQKEKKIAEQKEKINTGNKRNDFNNSIDLLHNYAKD